MINEDQREELYSFSTSPLCSIENGMFAGAGLSEGIYIPSLQQSTESPLRFSLICESFSPSELRFPWACKTDMPHYILRSTKMWNSLMKILNQ